MAWTVEAAGTRRTGGGADRDGRGGRPVILVSGPDRGGLAAWLFLALAVRRAGGRPLRATPSRPRSEAVFAGLIVSGGADVDPALYGEQRDRLLDEIRAAPSGLSLAARWLLFPLVFLLRRLLAVRRLDRLARRMARPGRRLGFRPSGGSAGQQSGPDPARDALELSLIDRALSAGRPVLGVCRGAQLLNVRFGGCLHQDVRPFYVETPHLQTVLPRKTVRLAPDSRLAAILGPAPLAVNALHRQAVRCLDRGMRISAREESGVIQAVERIKEPFVIGVQWHPEFLPQDRRQRDLFAALVEAARRASRAGEAGSARRGGLPERPGRPGREDPEDGQRVGLRAAQPQGSCP